MSNQLCLDKSEESEMVMELSEEISSIDNISKFTAKLNNNRLFMLKGSFISFLLLLISAGIYKICVFFASVNEKVSSRSYENNDMIHKVALKLLELKWFTGSLTLALFLLVLLEAYTLFFEGTEITPFKITKLFTFIILALFWKSFLTAILFLI